jgi:uncharacterized membrane protein YgdD (TMEM256/DUF423 family)
MDAAGPELCSRSSRPRDIASQIDVASENMLMTRLWLTAGAPNGLISVAAVAFGAHALQNLPERHFNAFRTGSQYQMYHALALLMVGLVPASRAADVAGWCMLSGIVLFSGSLYALALSRVNWLGAITPIGGVLMLVGWAALVVAGLRRL